MSRAGSGCGGRGAEPSQGGGAVAGGGARVLKSAALSVSPVENKRGLRTSPS